MRAGTRFREDYDDPEGGGRRVSDRLRRSPTTGKPRPPTRSGLTRTLVNEASRRPVPLPLDLTEPVLVWVLERRRRAALQRPHRPACYEAMARNTTPTSPRATATRGRRRDQRHPAGRGGPPVRVSRGRGAGGRKVHRGDWIEPTRSGARPTAPGLQGRRGARARRPRPAPHYRQTAGRVPDPLAASITTAAGIFRPVRLRCTRTPARVVVAKLSRHAPPPPSAAPMRRATVPPAATAIRVTRSATEEKGIIPRTSARVTAKRPVPAPRAAKQSDRGCARTPRGSPGPVVGTGAAVEGAPPPPRRGRPGTTPGTAVGEPWRSSAAAAPPPWQRAHAEDNGRPGAAARTRARRLPRRQQPPHAVVMVCAQTKQPTGTSTAPTRPPSSAVDLEALGRTKERGKRGPRDMNHAESTVG